jgi:hypothetical protein
MSEAALTAFFAVLVYVIGQFVQNFILAPVQEQHRLIGEVAFTITYYHNVKPSLQTTEDKELAEAKDAIRKLASQLRATAWTIPLYWLFAPLRLIPKRKAIMQASKSMIGYSNSLRYDDIKAQHEEEIIKALKIDWRT